MMAVTSTAERRQRPPVVSWIAVNGANDRAIWAHSICRRIRSRAVTCANAPPNQLRSIRAFGDRAIYRDQTAPIIRTFTHRCVKADHKGFAVGAPGHPIVSRGSYTRREGNRRRSIEITWLSCCFRVSLTVERGGWVTAEVEHGRRTLGLPHRLLRTSTVGDNSPPPGGLGGEPSTDATLVGDHPDEPLEIIQLIRAGSLPRIPGFRRSLPPAGCLLPFSSTLFVNAGRPGSRRRRTARFRCSAGRRRLRGLLMPGSLNGEPGEELAWPGVLPPAASMS